MMRAEALLNFGYMDVIEVVIRDFQRAYQDRYLADMSDNMSVFGLAPEVWSDAYYQSRTSTGSSFSSARSWYPSG